MVVVGWSNGGDLSPIFLNLSPFISYFSLHSVSLYAGEHKFLQMGSNLGKNLPYTKGDPEAWVYMYLKGQCDEILIFFLCGSLLSFKKISAVLLIGH